MTLIVARISGPNVWMVSDTAISGGNLEARQREYYPKIEPSDNGRALVGFAGDQHHGARLARNAARLATGTPAVQFLLEGHREHPSVDFVYAYTDELRPHLIRVRDNKAEELTTLHLGETDAFSHFQRIQHDLEIDFAPEAIKMFVAGSRASEQLPQGLSVAIVAMLRLFAERAEHDVGGWPVPYLLTAQGAFLCGYAYAVSDPIMSKLGPGSIVPHGTAEAGGFGLSLTELGVGQGMVVYWLQRPGGNVFVKAAEGYAVHTFDGPPSVFKEKATSAIGQRVEIFFGDTPIEPLTSITVVRDEHGLPSMAIAKHGNSFSFSILNLGHPFRARASLPLGEIETEKPGGLLSNDNFIVTLSDDKRTACLTLKVDGQPANEVTLGASELDQVIAALGEARALMSEPIAREPIQSSTTRELMVIDPAWRTERAVHASLNGLTLRLRHPGLGWLTFLIPYHEAKNLGQWLLDHSAPPNSR